MINLIKSFIVNFIISSFLIIITNLNKVFITILTNLNIITPFINSINFLI